MGWYKRHGDDLYRAETAINAPGWSTDDEAMTATGLVAVITARLDKVDPPRTPEEQAAYQVRYTAQEAILDATLALMELAHTDGEPWTQPTGAHNAVPLNRTVTNGGKTWRSKHPANVWPPSSSSPWWEEVIDGDQGPQPWALGTYYFIDTRVTFGGQTWRCLHEHLAQVGWEPGAPGMHAVWSID